MFLAEILSNHFQSVAIIGMAKNTGKTYTFNHLALEGQRLGLNCALTSIGFDGEERDSVFAHRKPRITVWPGTIVANAKSLLLASGLDLEILATTGVSTPLGEVVLARVRSMGQMLLAGPGSARDLNRVKCHLAHLPVDLFLVDGAVDRRSISAPLLTDTAVLAVGAEVAWERQVLLSRLRHFLSVLTLEEITDAGIVKVCRAAPEEIKVLAVADQRVVGSITKEQYATIRRFVDPLPCVDVVFVRGMLTDDLLTVLLPVAAVSGGFTLVASDPTAVFLTPSALARLAVQGIKLKVLQSLHLSAVTVNPFHSRYGYTDPLKLLRDVGRTVYPLPCYDLRLGLRYVATEEEIDAVP